MTKSEYERLIFDRFMEAVGLVPDRDSVHQREDPDVRCRIQGVPHGFELTAATDAEIEKGVRQDQVFSGFAGVDVVSAAARKVERGFRYDIPVDLIIHEATMPLPPPERWRDQLAGYLSCSWSQSGFGRLWVVNPWPTECPQDRRLFEWPPGSAEVPPLPLAGEGWGEGG